MIKNLQSIKIIAKMEQIKKSAHRRDIAIQTQNFSLDRSHHKSSSKQQPDEESPSKPPQKSKSQAQIIKEYEKKISAMSQTILKLTKKNQEHKEQFRILNQKLNKAFSKLTPSKLKISEERSEQTMAVTQQLQRVKKDLENEMKRSKQLKRDVQVLKETQNLLNNQDTFLQLKNELVEKQREIKELKQTIRGYERAEQSQKKMTHFKKQQELNKKLHQLNEENIFMKKKVTQLKTKIQEHQKLKAFQKAQNAIEKNLKHKKTTDSQQWVKKQLHDEQVFRLQQQIKIYESVKHTLQKTHKQQVDSLKKQNQILSDQVDELKFEIKKKNKEKFILQHRTHQVSQMKKSRLQQERNSLTIDVDDKNQRYRTFSLHLKSESDVGVNGLRRQFLGLSYGNFGNDYKKLDDSTRLDETRAFTISSIKFKYFEQHILSLKTKYKYSNGQEIQLQTFDVEHYYTNVKTAQLTFQDHQYIKQLEIYCGKMVEFIQLKTSRNQTLQVGNQKNQVKCKKYTFDIKNYQKPVAFGSITQVKKTGDTKNQCLVDLGLIMKRKDISINKKRLLVSSKNQPINEKDSPTETTRHTQQIKHLHLNEGQKNETIIMSSTQKEKVNTKQKDKLKQDQKKEYKAQKVEKDKQKKQGKAEKIQKLKAEKVAQKKIGETEKRTQNQHQKSLQKPQSKTQQPKSSESPFQQKSKQSLKR